MKRFLSLAVLIAMLWGCGSVEDTPATGGSVEDTPATEEKKEITLTLNLDGGEGQTEITGKYGATVTKPTDPTKTGYTFAGWNPELPTTFPAESATYTAQWAGGTGTVYKVEHYQQNITDDEYTLADTENKTGTTDEETSAQAKTYEGFTAQEVEQVKIAVDGSSVVKIYYDRKIITLTLIPVKYGQEKITITGKYGATVNVPDPTRDNYRFTNWSPMLPDTFPAEDPDYKYEAEWVRILDITYELNGGNWIDGFTPKEKWERGEDISLPTAENIEKAGYNFDGWLRGKRIITEILDSTSDVTVTAQWLEIYAITYDLDGGTNAESNPKEYTKKTETITLADATKTGYTFGGWYTDKAFTEESKVTQIEQGTTGVQTLYAKWLEVYTITYDLNGGNWIDGFTPEEKGELGDKILLPTAEKIEKAGCNFAGWLRGIRIITEIDVTSDVTVTAQWTE